MTRLTIDLSLSLDGYVAGPDPSRQDPLGVVVASPTLTHIRYRAAT